VVQPEFYKGIGTKEFELIRPNAFFIGGSRNTRRGPFMPHARVDNLCHADLNPRPEIFPG
jgi:hypothetical protein